MSDLLRALAFAYRRKGVDAMGGAELRLLLAYDLRWFAPEDAKRFVQRAVEVGALREEGERMVPSFDVGAVEIPLNFRPGPFVLEEAPTAEPPPSTAGSSELERAAEDERRRRGLLLSLDVARLVVRRRKGEDVAAEAATLEAQKLSAGAPPRSGAP